MTDSAFKGRVVAVTGASSGLGAALAVAFAAQGAKLALHGRDEARLDETVRSCEAAGGEAIAVAGDVRREDDCIRFVKEAEARFGGVDYLVACAGVSMWSRFDEVDDIAVFRELMEINYLGVVGCVRAALPHLKKRRGMIVAVSSIQGRIGVPMHTGYAAAKHAVEGFLDSLRTEVAPDVDILTVMPHWLGGTRLRENALAAGAHRRPSDHGVPLDECCRKIMQAIRRRQRELMVPRWLAVVPWLRLMAPKLLESRVAVKVAREGDEADRAKRKL